MFFLDFDLTIFKTYSFASDVIAKDPRFAKEVEVALKTPSGSPERGVLWDHLGDALEKEEVTFSTHEAPKYVFEDVWPFLESNGKNAVIVTHGNEAFQRFKVENSGVGEMVNNQMYIQGLKGPALQEVYGESKPEGIFIDDTKEQLESVASECPWLQVVEMRRDGKEALGAFDVVHDFSELGTLIEK